MKSVEEQFGVADASEVGSKEFDLSVQRLGMCICASVVEEGQYSFKMVQDWSKAFMDAGKARLNGDTKREADSGEVAEMRKQNGELKEALAEEILRNRFLKKLSKGMEQTLISAT